MQIEAQPKGRMDKRYNTAMSLREMTELIAEEAHNRHDFIAPSNKVNLVVSEENEIMMDLNENGIFVPNKNAHNQMSEKLNIPHKFYERMRTSHPDILADVGNKLMQRENQSLFIRTVGERARAVLSDRYTPIDNYELLEKAILPQLLSNGGLENYGVVSATVTEEKMHIKVVSNLHTGEVAPGDVFQAGFIISNSEVGLSSVSLSFFMLRLLCSNGLIGESLMRKYHIGARESVSENVQISKRTKVLDNASILSRVRDVISTAIDEDTFNLTLEQFKAAKRVELPNPQDTIDGIMEVHALKREERDSIMRHFIEQGESTKYGLVNAVTAAARVGSLNDYERANNLEQAANKILYMRDKALQELRPSKRQ